MNPRRLLLFGGVILLLSAALLLWARDLIRELIVLPLSYLIWAGGLFVENTPQIFFWSVLLVLSSVAAYRSLAGRGKETFPEPIELDTGPRNRPISGRVVFWSFKVGGLRQTNSPYFRGTFEQAVGKLLFDTLAYRFRLTQNQLEDALRDGSLDVPPEVRAYALDGLRRLDPDPVPFWPALWERIVGALRGLLSRTRLLRARAFTLPAETNAQEERVLIILKYLEKELEVPNDDSGR